MIYTDINDLNKEYSLILADPPWQIKKGGKTKARPNSSGKPLDYPTLMLDEIQNHLQIALSHTTDNAIIFLWTIDSYLDKALQMIKDLGLKKHIVMIWDKNQGMAPAFSVRFVHEYLIYAYKGKFQRPAKEAQGKYGSVFHTIQNGKHSQKPEIAFEIIETLYPDFKDKRLEMYARSTRQGWDSFGNEVENKGGVENENKIESTTS